MIEDELDREALDAWDVEPLGARFEDDVLAAWDEEQPQSQQPQRNRRAGAWAAGVAFAAAAAVVLALWPRPEGGANDDGVVVRAGRSAAVEREPGSGEATQTAGTVTYDVTPGAPFVVRTPAADITVLGTEFTVEILEKNDMKRKQYLGAGALAMTSAAVAVYVSSGHVEVRNDHGAVDLQRGQSAVASEHLAPSAEPRRHLAASVAEPPPAKRRITAAEREDVQRRLADALSRAGPAAEPRSSDTPRLREDEKPAESTLDEEYIREVVREDLLPIAHECYRSALEDQPDLSGRLMLHFSITGDESVGGIVDEVSIGEESTMKHPMLGECMAESTASLLFEPPQGGGTMKVTYPFVFEPTNEDADADADPAG